MSMTMTQKILATAAGLKSIEAGDLIECNLDLVLGNDITTPVAIDEFEKCGGTSVFDKEKIAIVLDHFTPNKDIEAAELCKRCRIFANKHRITNFFDVGEAGIEHALLPEKGLVGPGDTIIGADSHTCTYGALGAFSTGVGSTDMAAGLINGKAWFKVPTAVKVVLSGSMKEYVSGKDVILHLIGLIGVDGARYESLEFTGEGVADIPMDDRFTISNMAIEAGAKNGIFPVDDKTLEYCKDRFMREIRVFEADPDAEYSSTLEINLSELKPTVSLPHLPENTKTVDGLEKITIDQSVIGSCTNGRITDMRIAAGIMKGHKVSRGVRCIVIPATQAVYLQCIQEGLVEIFINAGAIFSMPTCGPCLGGHMGVLAEGERSISTTNRNFVGRMGHPKSEVVLASPAVAAASAIAGFITTPDKI